MGIIESAKAVSDAVEVARVAEVDHKSEITLQHVEDIRDKTAALLRYIPSSLNETLARQLEAIESVVATGDFEIRRNCREVWKVIADVCHYDHEVEKSLPDNRRLPSRVLLNDPETLSSIRCERLRDRMPGLAQDMSTVEGFHASNAWYELMNDIVLPKMAELETSVYSSPCSPKDLGWFVGQHRRHDWLVATDEEGDLSTMKGYMLYKIYGEHRALKILRMAADPTLGAAALAVYDQLLHRLTEFSMPGVPIEKIVSVEPLSARDLFAPLYLRNRFKASETIPDYYENDDAIVFVRDLSHAQ
jgi:hypothetical protein